MIRDLADGRSRFCELERSLAGISPAHALAAPARARGGGHRRPPDVPRGPAARRVRADGEGPRARADHRVDARRTAPSGSAPPAPAARPQRSRSPSPPPEPGRSALAFRPARLIAIPRAARPPGGSPPRAANRRRMHNRALHDSLAAFVEEAARQLADEVSGGAEVPFELMEMSPHARAASPAVLLPAAHGPLHRRARRRARAPALLPRRRAGDGRAARPARLPAVARAPHARARTAARRPTPRCRRS